jgi:hypothetical protein
LGVLRPSNFGQYQLFQHDLAVYETGCCGVEGIELDARTTRWIEEYELVRATESLQDARRESMLAPVAETATMNLEEIEKTTACRSFCNGYGVATDTAGRASEINSGPYRLAKRSLEEAGEP